MARVAGYPTARYSGGLGEYLVDRLSRVLGHLDGLVLIGLPEGKTESIAVVDGCRELEAGWYEQRLTWMPPLHCWPARKKNRPQRVSRWFAHLATRSVPDPLRPLPNPQRVKWMTGSKLITQGPSST